MFINIYKQFDIIKYYKKFLKKILKLKLYLIELTEDNTIKKNYLDKYVMNSSKC